MGWISLKARREYRLKNRERINELNREWRQKNKKLVSKYAVEDRKKHPRGYKRRRKSFRERHPSYDQIYMRRIRLEVLKKYGGRCRCCGIDIFEFLSFDHIRGRGRKHRLKILATGQKLLMWLRKRPRQKSIQILCHNCNQSFGHYGYCPHHPNIKRKVIR